MPEKVKPLFILCLVRSGSTLLQRILAGHSKISTTGEPWLLLPYLFAHKKQGTLTAYAHATSHTGVADFIENLPGKYNEYYARLSDFVTQLYTSASGDGDVYFLDKTPRYYLIIDELNKMFPHAKFVFLFRDPIQIYASIMQTWGNNSFRAFNRYGFYKDLTEGFGMISEGYEHIKEKSISLRYEDLIDQPEKELNKILDYLELDHETKLVESITSHHTRGRNYDPTMDLSRSLDDQSLNKWKMTFNSSFRKARIKKYIMGLSDKSLAVQGYVKDDLLGQLDSLDKKGRFNVLRDYFDYKKAMFINSYNRLSYC